jgi:hypothetical protein
MKEKTNQPPPGAPAAETSAPKTLPKVYRFFTVFREFGKAPGPRLILGTPKNVNGARPAQFI